MAKKYTDEYWEHDIHNKIKSTKQKVNRKYQRGDISEAKKLEELLDIYISQRSRIRLYDKIDMYRRNRGY